MADRTYGSFEDVEGVHGYTREDIEQMSRERKIGAMVDWFHAHFEDPAERTPYETREGGYQWIWGGPHTADEEVQDEFSEVIDFETMQDAVREIENDGLFEWAPTPKPGDYGEEEYDERVASGEIVDGDGEWPPVIAVQRDKVTELEARREVVRRLDHLEELIRPLVSSNGMIGHNRPPEPIEVEHPCSLDEWITVSMAVQRLREQTAAEDPDEENIAVASLTLGTVARKLTGWLQVRLEKGIDAAIVACGTAAGASAVINIRSILDGIGDVITAVSRWVEALPPL